MKKGEIWAARDSGPYTGKPRPVVVVQERFLDEYESVVVCLMTSSLGGPGRVRVEPSSETGLSKLSWVMTEKLVTVPQSRMAYKIGELNARSMVLVNDALGSLLGLG